jgi:aminoglycoside 3-N-acetyltransferase
VVGALLSTWNSVIMPTFTYKAMVTPEEGPPDNGLLYGCAVDHNRMAEFFTPDMPADRLMGAVPEALRQHPLSERSMHPILSFTGVRAGPVLAAQSLEEPLAPVRCLVEQEGWVVLLGVDHTVNTSIHYGERLAGRKNFTRWALTEQGILECPGFPGCSDGFQEIEPHVQAISRRTAIGGTFILAMPLSPLIETVRRLVADNPLALLCEKDYCERCRAVRAALRSNGGAHG